MGERFGGLLQQKRGRVEVNGDFPEKVHKCHLVAKDSQHFQGGVVLPETDALAQSDTTATLLALNHLKS